MNGESYLSNFTPEGLFASGADGSLIHEVGGRMVQDMYKDGVLLLRVPVEFRRENDVNLAYTYTSSTADGLRSMADPMFEDLIDERHDNRCTDCHEPTGPVVVCESCATSRCESVAAAQRLRDADICRQIHSTSRQRVELALLCAREIEASDHTHP